MVHANVDAARRDYEALIAKVETRHEHFYAKASYTWSRSRGGSVSEPWNAYSGTEFDFYPTHFVNRYGYLSGDRRHVVKLSGYALLPWDLTVSLAYAWASAPALDTWAYCGDVTPGWLEDDGYDPAINDYCDDWGTNRTHPIFLEPRGSRRGSANYNLDLGLAKAFRIGPTNLELNLAVLNVWGDERPKEYQEQEFTDVPVGSPTKFTEPRRYQVGVRVEF
jgi:hypothetical protein